MSNGDRTTRENESVVRTNFERKLPTTAFALQITTDLSASNQLSSERPLSILRAPYLALNPASHI